MNKNTDILNVQLQETNNTITVSWTIDKEWLLEKHKNNQHVYILIRTAATNSENSESRIAVNINDGIAILPFKTPGDHIIEVYLMSDPTIKFANEVIKLWINHWELVPKVDSEKRLTYQVPTYFFDDKPRIASSKWLNLLFKTQPQDQCQLYRRILFAYIIQPPLLLVMILLRLLLCVGFTLSFLKGFSYKNALYPRRSLSSQEYEPDIFVDLKSRLDFKSHKFADFNTWLIAGPPIGVFFGVCMCIVTLIKFVCFGKLLQLTSLLFFIKLFCVGYIGTILTCISMLFITIIFSFIAFVWKNSMMKLFVIIDKHKENKLNRYIIVNCVQNINSNKTKSSIRFKIKMLKARLCKRFI